jgi:hypothetical protein
LVEVGDRHQGPGENFCESRKDFGCAGSLQFLFVTIEMSGLAIVFVDNLLVVTGEE